MTSTSFSIADGVLRITGRAIDTELSVAQAVQVGEKVVARFEVPHGMVRNDNVVCYDQQGTLLWTIQPSPHGGTKDNPYVFIQFTDDAKIVAQNWNGVEYQINADDGTVSAIGLKRF